MSNEDQTSLAKGYAQIVLDLPDVSEDFCDSLKHICKNLINSQVDLWPQYLEEELSLSRHYKII